MNLFNDNQDLLLTHSTYNPILHFTNNPLNKNQIFYSQLNGYIYLFDLSNKNYKLVKNSSNAVNKLKVHDKQLISSSWDSSISFNDIRDNNTDTIDLPNKCYDFDTSNNLLVTALSDRQLAIFDLRNLKRPLQLRESSLKFMTTSVACFPNDLGFVTSSIEGRIAIDYFDPSPQAQQNKYAFKCHRHPSNDDSGDVIYPINILKFHSVLNTFASGASDGHVAIWDPVAKKRVKQYGKYQNAVQSLDFSDDGNSIVVAYSPPPENSSNSNTSIGFEIKHDIFNDCRVSISYNEFFNQYLYLIAKKIVIIHKLLYHIYTKFVKNFTN